MLRKNHRYSIAIAGLVLAAAVSPQRTTQGKPADAQEKIQWSVKPVKAAIGQAKVSEYEGACRPGDMDHQSDRCAQWYAALAAGEAAKWSFWSFVVAAVSAALSFVGLGALIVTIRQGRDGLKIASEALDHDIRPIVLINSMDVDVGHAIVARFELINMGAGPAQIVDAVTTIYRKVREGHSPELQHPIPETSGPIFIDGPPVLLKEHLLKGSFTVCAIDHLKHNRATFRVIINYRHALRQGTRCSTEFEGEVFGGSKKGLRLGIADGLIAQPSGYDEASEDDILTAWITIDQKSWKFK